MRQECFIESINPETGELERFTGGKWRAQVPAEYRWSIGWLATAEEGLTEDKAKEWLAYINAAYNAKRPDMWVVNPDGVRFGATQAIKLEV